MWDLCFPNHHSYFNVPYYQLTLKVKMKFIWLNLFILKTSKKVTYPVFLKFFILEKKSRKRESRPPSIIVDDSLTQDFVTQDSRRLKLSNRETDLQNTPLYEENNQTSIKEDSPQTSNKENNIPKFVTIRSRFSSNNKKENVKQLEFDDKILVDHSLETMMNMAEKGKFPDRFFLIGKFLYMF